MNAQFNEFQTRYSCYTGVYLGQNRPISENNVAVIR
jgi:hypothetical protein